jgi:hypothetical protein
VGYGEPVSEESDDVLDAADHNAAELVVAQLISRVKTLRVAEIDLPIVDESCMWVVTGQAAGTLADDGADTGTMNLAYTG